MNTTQIPVTYTFNLSGHFVSTMQSAKYITKDGLTVWSGLSSCAPHEYVKTEYVCDGKVVANEIALRPDWFFLVLLDGNFGFLKGDEISDTGMVIYVSAATLEACKAKADSLFSKEGAGD